MCNAWQDGGGRAACSAAEDSCSGFIPHIPAVWCSLAVWGKCSSCVITCRIALQNCRLAGASNVMIGVLKVVVWVKEGGKKEGGG